MPQPPAEFMCSHSPAREPQPSALEVISLTGMPRPSLRVQVGASPTRWLLARRSSTPCPSPCSLACIARLTILHTLWVEAKRPRLPRKAPTRFSMTGSACMEIGKAKPTTLFVNFESPQLKYSIPPLAQNLPRKGSATWPQGFDIPGAAEGMFRSVVQTFELVQCRAEV